MNELMEVRNDAVMIKSDNPMQAILQAISAGGVDPKSLELMMSLQERFEKSEAVKAFNRAFARFKSANISVEKTKQVSFGNTKYKHAELSHVCQKIGDELSKNGLSFRWLTDTTKSGVVSVTCVLSHEMGHHEQTEMSAPPDSSGQKNPVQQVASTVTYLQRYTLLSITGTATGEDTDAIGGISDHQMQSMLDSISECTKSGELVGLTINYLKFCAEQKDGKSAEKITNAMNAKRAELQQKRD